MNESPSFIYLIITKTASGLMHSACFLYSFSDSVLKAITMLDSISPNKGQAIKFAKMRCITTHLLFQNIGSSPFFQLFIFPAKIGEQTVLTEISFQKVKTPFSSHFANNTPSQHIKKRTLFTLQK